MARQITEQMLGRVRVGNKRSDASEDFKPELEEVIVHIDRPNILSNPFKHRSRPVNIELFDDFLLADIKHQGMLTDEMRRIADLVLSGHDVILMCWCKPLPCHGDILQREIEKIVDNLASGSTRRET